MPKEKLYKVLGAGHKSCNGGAGTWTPRKWMPEIKGDLVPCQNGYHLCRRSDLLHWLNAEIWEATYRGDRVDADAKVIVRQARITKRLVRWNERTARLFACDCAERALKKYSKNPDPRSMEAIRVARLFPDGLATSEELAAANYAAYYAAYRAANSAANSAANYAANSAAYRAAYRAARDAANSAANYAAYYAAYYAADPAARDAANSAANYAAYYAAYYAACDAANSAEKKWQTKRLFEYLDGKRK